MILALSVLIQKHCVMPCVDTETLCDIGPECVDTETLCDIGPECVDT